MNTDNTLKKIFSLTVNQKLFLTLVLTILSAVLQFQCVVLVLMQKYH